ncbi:hypothetical protein QTP88_018983 [Uroleucon formosanum]
MLKNLSICLIRRRFTCRNEGRTSGPRSPPNEKEKPINKIAMMLNACFTEFDEIVSCHHNQPDTFAKIKEQLEIESGTEHLLMWFGDNYVLGRVRKTLRNGNIIRGLPLFSPDLWSVFIRNIPRTQNNIEAWHRRWECLFGESHVGVYRLIKKLQKEQKNTEIMIESILHGVPCPHSKQKNEQREGRIQKVIQNHRDVPVMEFLRGIAYNMTL